MTKKEFDAAEALTDRIVRELFANGGPQRPTDMRKAAIIPPGFENVISCTKSLPRKDVENPVLLKEQQRLMRTWNKGD
jgi:hypothetical protein